MHYYSYTAPRPQFDPISASTHLRSISLEYSYQDLCAATSNWGNSYRLGSGSYGAVYKGDMVDGSEVAIKVIDLAALAAAGQNLENAGFEEEVQMLSKFRHPNLVTLMGWGKHQHARYLVYELLPGGDAFQRLAKSLGGEKPFLGNERLSVCYDASLGLSHMHNAKPQAFHRDIKSANILLDRHGQAKMADFGLSCASKQKHDNSVRVKIISGTPGYACPIYSQTGIVTEGSEVYSFGMVMLEMLCGLAPAAGDPHRPGNIIYPIADTIVPLQPDALSRAMRHIDVTAQWAPSSGLEIGQLALRCVSYDESLRPKFKEVVQTLRRIMEAYPTPEVVVAPSAPPSYANQIPQIPAAYLVSPPAAQPQQAASAQAKFEPRVGARVRLDGLQTVAYNGRAGVLQEFKEQQQQWSVRLDDGQEICVKCVNLVAEAAGASAQGQVQAQAKAQSAGYSSSHLKVPQQEQTTPETSGGNATKASFFFLLISASGLEVDSMDASKRKLHLVPSVDSTGTSTAQVGRNHQPEAFEAWVPDAALRSCISRTAFELSWSGTGDNVSFCMQGTNPMAVDGKPAVRNQSVRLNHGSEVSFLYAQDDQKHFLVLSLLPVPGHLKAVSPRGNETSSPRPPSAVAGDAGGKASRNPSPQPEQNVTRSSPMPKTPSPPAQSSRSRASTGSATWRLECTFAEGLSTLAKIPTALKTIVLQDSCTQVGRQHQTNVFEALASHKIASAENRSLMSYISRNHIKLEIRDGGLTATNESSNPIYIDEKVLREGESYNVAQDQCVSFARNEDAYNHLKFLTFKVRSPEDAD